MNDEMEATTYLLKYRLNALVRYLLWRAGEIDTFHMSGGSIMSFDAPESAITYATRIGLRVSTEEPVLHDLDAARSWIVDSVERPVDCAELLLAWNMFDDVRATLDPQPVPLSIEEAVVFEKLLLGSNLPAMTPDGESYIPVWSAGERQVLADRLSAGLAMFEPNVRCCVEVDLER